MSVTSVRIEEDLEILLASVIKDMRRSKGWIINEALREYLRSRIVERQRWQDTLEALEAVRAGKVVESERVHAWLKSWGTENEEPSPLT